VLVVGISGSLRRDSHNTALVRAAARLLPPRAELVEYDGLGALPAFSEDDEPAPGPAVDAFRGAIVAADAVLIATPEYNASIPGALKNALDWASRPTCEAALLDKPVAVVGASAGMFGAVWAQAETRKVLRASGARVVDRELPVARAASAFTADGRLADADLETELRAILVELLGRRFPPRREPPASPGRIE
jgi:chromate reductase